MTPVVNVEASVVKAGELANQGKLDEACQLLETTIAAHPDHAGVYHALGLLQLQSGNLTQAAASLEQAVRADSSQPAYYSNLGLVCLKLGRREEAIAHFKQAIALNSAFPQAYNNLGLAYHEDEQYEQAIEAFRQAISYNPDYSVAHHNLSRALRQLRQYDEAIGHAQRAIELNPQYGQAYRNLGGILYDLGQWQQAREVLEKSLQFNPTQYETYRTLGAIAIRQNRLDDALSLLETALSHDPNCAETHYLMGSVWHGKAQMGKALTHFKSAVQRDPGYALAWGAMGTIYATFHDVYYDSEQAFQALKKAYEHRHRLSQYHQVELISCLGDLNREVGNPEEAIQWYDTALALGGHDGLRLLRAFLLPVIYPSSADIDRWRNRYEAEIDALLQTSLTISDPIKQVGLSHGFYLAYQNKHDKPLQEKAAQLFSHLLPAYPFVPKIHQKPRIGFISRYLYPSHTIGKLMRGLIDRLSRDKFDVVILTQDSNRPLGLTAPHEWVVYPKNIQAAQALIGEYQLDVLFYTDIGMDPFTYYLASRRLALVQCVTWGHPVTTGLPSMDYFISSELIEPDDADEHYSERLVRLKSLPSYYYWPEGTNTTIGKTDLGLPESGQIYFCPQSLFKFHPDYDDVLAEILRQDPDGRLVILEGSREQWTQLLINRWKGSMADVMDRVIVLPRQSRERFLQLISVADVMLDTFYFGGGNTTYEALAMATPLVTMPGPFMRGRVAYGCYRQMGMMDCVTSTPEDYVKLAVRLGTDRDYRLSIQEAIRQSHRVLFEDNGVVTELETFFLDAVSQARNQAEK